MKLLVVRLGSLGDIVHTAPALAALRDAMPRAEIHWLVDIRHLDLLELMEGVSRIVPMRSTAAGWISAAAALRRERYDVALDFQGLLKSAVLARLAGARTTAGFARPALRESAASTFYNRTIEPPGGVHVIEKNLSLLRAVDVATPPAPEFRFVVRPSAALQRTRSLVGPRFAIVNPGAAWPNKRWPPDRFGALAAELRARADLPSIVTWGPAEGELAEQVVAASCGAAALAPATSVADLFALSRAATLMVSGDTGPLHIAAAVGTPVVGVYGPTDPARNGPWSPDDVCVSRFAECGCHHKRSCEQPRWCLADVQVSEVLAAVERRLAAVRVP
jgi:lipopolysaccharide heptosyltransferase I